MSDSAVMSLSDQAWPFLCDWDDDGDLDMLVGGGYGWPRILINNGTSRKPAFSEPQFILSEGKPIRILRDEVLGGKHWHNMGYPYPAYVDWDGDGLPDLMLPNETNRIFWYRNIGTRKGPRFGPRLQLICDGYPDCDLGVGPEAVECIVGGRGCGGEDGGEQDPARGNVGHACAFRGDGASIGPARRLQTPASPCEDGYRRCSVPSTVMTSPMRVGSSRVRPPWRRRSGFPRCEVITACCIDWSSDTGRCRLKRPLALGGRTGRRLLDRAAAEGGSTRKAAR
jgi:hypothetical protein